MNKKGQSTGDIIFLLVGLFILGVGGVITSYWVGEVTSQMASQETVASVPQAVAVLEATNDLNQFWDMIVLFFMFGVAIGMVVAGFFIKADSIFFPIYVVSLTVGVIFAVVIQQAWLQFSTTTLFTTIIEDNFRITSHIFENILLYYSIFGFLGLVVTYAKIKFNKETGV